MDSLIALGEGVIDFVTNVRVKEKAKNKGKTGSIVVRHFEGFSGRLQVGFQVAIANGTKD